MTPGSLPRPSGGSVACLLASGALALLVACHAGEVDTATPGAPPPVEQQRPSVLLICVDLAEVGVRDGGGRVAREGHGAPREQGDDDGRDSKNGEQAEDEGVTQSRLQGRVEA